MSKASDMQPTATLKINKTCQSDIPIRRFLAIGF
jgi:hypothetical protein